MRLVRDVLFEYLHEAGFANARLALEDNHLPFPLLGLLPRDC
jgi:hypothetical protein